MKASFTSFGHLNDSKPHYLLLDGLRGVAALLVVWYHVHEGFAFAAGLPAVGGINHGYLAVDFFFILSGFVVGYAYDDRWTTGMQLKDFFVRRLIRLHPMVVMGTLVGMVCFLLQGGVQWDGSEVPLVSVLLSVGCALLMLPVFPGTHAEVRGNGEAFPLNGPSWSLFFEYIGNLLYALFLRRLSTRWLTVWVGCLGVGLIGYTWFDISGYGSFGVGWSMGDGGFAGGLLRMLFPFSAGLLLSRVYVPLKLRGAFWICSFALLLLFLVPPVSGNDAICLNGVYESFCIIVVFPILVWLGASGDIREGISSRICHFLGEISYPLYITHYPVMYLFYSWLIKHKYYTLSETWPMVLLVCVWNIAFAYLCLRLYDLPIRHRLTVWLRGQK